WFEEVLAVGTRCRRIDNSVWTDVDDPDVAGCQLRGQKPRERLLASRARAVPQDAAYRQFGTRLGQSQDDARTLATHVPCHSLACDEQRPQKAVNRPHELLQREVTQQRP